MVFSTSVTLRFQIVIEIPHPTRHVQELQRLIPASVDTSPSLF